MGILTSKQLILLNKQVISGLWPHTRDWHGQRIIFGLYRESVSFALTICCAFTKKPSQSYLIKHEQFIGTGVHNPKRLHGIFKRRYCRKNPSLWYRLGIYC